MQLQTRLYTRTRLVLCIALVLMQAISGYLRCAQGLWLQAATVQKTLHCSACAPASAVPTVSHLLRLSGDVPQKSYRRLFEFPFKCRGAWNATANETLHKNQARFVHHSPPNAINQWIPALCAVFVAPSCDSPENIALLSLCLSLSCSNCLAPSAFERGRAPKILL